VGSLAPQGILPYLYSTAQHSTAQHSTAQRYSPYDIGYTGGARSASNSAPSTGEKFFATTKAQHTDEILFVMRYFLPQSKFKLLIINIINYEKTFYLNDCGAGGMQQLQKR
jgi:hypothetical protein